MNFASVAGSLSSAAQSESGPRMMSLMDFRRLLSTLTQNHKTRIGRRGFSPSVERSSHPKGSCEDSSYVFLLHTAAPLRETKHSSWNWPLRSEQSGRPSKVQTGSPASTKVPNFLSSLSHLLG